MKNKMLNTVLAAGLCCAAVISNVANAGLIVNDVSDSFVTDTVTGFDWLDMRYTDGKSFNDVTGLLSTNSIVDSLDIGRWEIASMAEVLVLLKHQMFAGDETSEAAINDAASVAYTLTVPKNHSDYLSFVELKDWLGFTYNNTNSSMLRAYTSDTSTYIRNGALTGDHLTIQFGSYANHLAIGNGYLAVDTVSQFDHLSNANIGTFLVRKTTDVPEPTTFAIFALGLMGLALRKKKA